MLYFSTKLTCHEGWYLEVASMGRQFKGTRRQTFGYQGRFQDTTLAGFVVQGALYYQHILACNLSELWPFNTGKVYLNLSQEGRPSVKKY